MRGADALVSTLAAAGVRHVFALSGNHVMPVFDAALDVPLSLVHVRHEAAAVHMADAWARVTGEVGIALVTGGPGHANAVSALYTARMAESPVVLLSGHAPHAELGRGAFQEMEQAEIAAPVTKAAWKCASVDDVVHDVARALRLAGTGRPGPVHLSLPVDVLEAHTQAPAARATGDVPTAPSLTAAEQARLFDALQAAQRPLVLAGPAWCTPARRLLLAQLQARLGIPCIGMESPRGVNDPSLGAFAAILARADSVLLLGKRLDFTLGFGRSPPFSTDCRILQVDAEAFELERTGRAVGARLALALHGDPFALAFSDAPSAPPQLAQWCDEVEALLRWRPAEWSQLPAQGEAPLHPLAMCAPIQALLDRHPRAVLVCDGGEIGQWAQACLHAPRRIINGVAGAIGAAIPFALAARLAEPSEPVIAVMGDGTFGFHPAEYDTAVRHGLPFVAVVGNDARWNAEYQIQLRDYGQARAQGCTLQPLRYDLVAVAFGGHGEHVDTAATMAPALERALAAGRPACVDVSIEGLAAPLLRP